MAQDDERIRILEQIERGEINVDEGLRQLSTQPEEPVDQAGATGSMLDAPAPSLALAPEVAVLSASESAATFGREMDSSQVGWVSEQEPMPTPPEIESWKRWWRAPLAAGVAIIVASTVLMYLALQASGAGFWFACATLPFLLGFALAALAWASRTSRWLHVRVKTGQKSWPRNIAVSFPIPIRLTAWFLRTFKPNLPNLQGTSLDELILALEYTSSDAPLYVDVAEGANGERVQVFIG